MDKYANICLFLGIDGGRALSYNIMWLKFLQPLVSVKGLFLPVSYDKI